MNFFFITIPFLMLSLICLSQTTIFYDEGMIIKTTGDTIKCFVPIALGYPKTVEYKTDKNSYNTIPIKTKDIQFLITPHCIFEQIPYKDRLMLMRVSSKGKIVLYCWAEGNEHPNDWSGPYYGNQTVNFLLIKDGLFYDIKRNNYKELLTELLQECPEIVLKIEKKIYRFDDLEIVIKEYNSCN